MISTSNDLNWLKACDWKEAKSLTQWGKLYCQKIPEIAVYIFISILKLCVHIYEHEYSSLEYARYALLCLTKTMWVCVCVCYHLSY